jgi:hypothetical protein
MDSSPVIEVSTVPNKVEMYLILRLAYGICCCVMCITQSVLLIINRVIFYNLYLVTVSSIHCWIYLEPVNGDAEDRTVRETHLEILFYLFLKFSPGFLKKIVLLWGYWCITCVFLFVKNENLLNSKIVIIMSVYKYFYQGKISTDSKKGYLLM